MLKRERRKRKHATALEIRSPRSKSLSWRPRSPPSHSKAKFHLLVENLAEVEQEEEPPVTEWPLKKRLGCVVTR